MSSLPPSQPVHQPRYHSMAFSPSQPSAFRPKTNMSVPQLLTPEEPLMDSFERKTVLPPMHTVPSPPESPAFNSFSLAAPETGYQQHDRILYPDHNNAATAPVDRPLFGPGPEDRWASPERHQSPAADSVSTSSSSSPPSLRASPFSDDSKSIGPTHSNASSPLIATEPIGPVALYNRWGVEYYRLMRAQMEDHRAQMLAHRKLPPVPASRGHTRDQYTQQQVSLLGRSHRIEKPRPVTKTTTTGAATKPKAAAKTTPSLKIDSPVKRSRRQALTPELPNALGAWQQAPAPKPRTRAAPSKKVDDKDYSEWASLPDYSPPVDSLTQTNKKLTATWNNSNSLSLDNDPDKQHLHPQEYDIASTLRLKCNQYLASKRRIFAAKVKALREGREFNKTSAQNCCTIDVNKASRLWMAFDGVGWFDDHWFQAHL